MTCPHCRARIPTSDNNIFQYYLDNSIRGRPYAQYDLEISYQNGTGTQQTLDGAARWFKAAAEQGHPWAMYAHGRCFRIGKGVTQDLSEAKSWYERSIEFQSLHGYFDLEMMYLYGIGIPKDEKEEFCLIHIAEVFGFEGCRMQAHALVCYWKRSAI